MRCPLCGFEFDETAMSCHSSCTFNAGCSIICCPNCGYQLTDEKKSRVASALRAMLARRAAPSGVCALSAMQPGQSGRVVEIRSKQHNRVERLHVLGVIEDAQVTLTQRRPAFVLRVGFTELSVERDIADDILVEVAPA